MKKWTVLFVSLAIVLGLVTLGLAQTQTKPKAHPASVFVGTVDKVTPADTTKGTKPEIVVIDKTKKSMTFVITNTCTIVDAKGTAVTVDKIVTGSEVRVRYKTTAEGVHEAVSVKLLT
jgi:hypothetical protein